MIGRHLAAPLFAALRERPVVLLNGARQAGKSTLATWLASGPESFVAMELRKQIGWSRTRPRMFHLRTTVGREVDIVLEVRGGRLVGVEVKASSTVNADDFKALRFLADAAGQRFQCGVVLYAGSESLPFGPRLHALPVSALWRLGAQRV